MARFILALLFAANALHAASTPFSSCTAGSTTISPCSNDPSLTLGGLSGPDYIVDAYAGVAELSATNLAHFGGTPAIPGGFALDAMANTVAYTSDASAPALSATAYASDTGTYLSAGPLRTGTIDFDIGLGYLHEDSGGAVTVTITDGTHTYTYSGGGGIFGSTPPVHCGMEDCVYTATLAFELGTTFQISVAANSGASSLFAGRGHDAEAEAVFNIFDANGAPVPYAPVPEPSTSALLGLALLGVGWFVRRPQQRQ